MYDLLNRFISSTAWPMTPPKAYGTFHLTFFFVGLAVSILLAWLLRRIGDKGNKILLVCVGSFLLLSEIYKQLFYFFYIGHGSYQWWIFPFQMCSVPMYLCFIAPFLKKGAVQKGMYNFLVFFNLMGGFISFFEPSGLIHEYWTLTIHAFLWHMSLVFLGLYIGFSKRAGSEKKDYLTACAAFVGLCIVAFCINLIFWKVSEGTINMFFVGPANNSLIVFKTIAEKFGWYISTLLYIPAVCLGAYIFYLPFHLFSKRAKNK
ncbi:MAG: YwaF family protein [Clostridia bacterium]|nr:YwaF family protein [Clostridia bacterium]